MDHLKEIECRVRFIFEAEGGNEDLVLVNLTSIPLDGVDTGRKKYLQRVNIEVEKYLR